MNTEAPLILASASPRRQQLLKRLGLDFQVRVADVDESGIDGETPEQYVSRVAALKAATVAAQAPGSCVIGADTTIALDGQVMGKPADQQDAEAMLQRLSGRSHHVLTAVHVYGPSGEKVSKLVQTKVTFASLSQADIKAYCQTSEPYDKAGAYAIQGNAARFIERIEGSYTAVVGLPLYELSQLLATFAYVCRFEE